jgi:iron complex transport system substrate-binding protein
MGKKCILYIVICFLLLPLSLYSGGGREKAGSEKRVPSRTIVDARGREVRLPLSVERIATFPVPHPHLIVALDGSAEKIIGAHPLTVSAAEVSVLGRIAPSLSNVETAFLTASRINAEELARMKPDVFFTDSVLEGMDTIEGLGIPVIYLGLIQEELLAGGSVRTVFSPPATMENWLEITAQVLDRGTEKAEEIMALFRSTEDAIRTRLEKQDTEQRPRALILFKTRGLMIAGAASFGDYWLAKTGAVNCAAGVESSHPAMVKISSFEEILKWDPQIVYLSNFDTTMPEDLYENKVPGQDWSAVSAVVDRRVYRIPLGMYRWYPPSLDGPLMLKWMAQKNHPDVFDWKIKEEIQDYFQKFYGYSLTEEETGMILNPAASGIY